MTRVDWRLVPGSGFRVPADAPLSDLTAELTALLGDRDPALRTEIALPVLTTWIQRGVYDDLLVGLGDGIATGLTARQPADEAAVRRACSARVLGAVIARDTAQPLVPRLKVLEWGDRLATWLLAERDLRDHVPGVGWIQAIAAGADALGELSASPHLGRPELSAVLDVLGERVLAEVADPWRGVEADRLAHATVRLLQRDALTLDEVEGWAARIGARALRHRPGTGEPDPVAANADAFLRAFYLVLALAPAAAPVRADLVLTLVDFLRELHPDLLG
jgi:hypothetical protein